MKMQKETFDAIHKIITEYVKEHNINLANELERYIKQRIGRNYEMRFRWDVFHAAGCYKKLQEMGKSIYDGNLNDAHVDTALKKIVVDIMVGQVMK